MFVTGAGGVGVLVIVGVSVIVRVRVGTRVRVGVRVTVGVREGVGLGPGVEVSADQGVMVLVALGTGVKVSVGGGVAVSGCGVGDKVAVALGGIASARVGISVGIGPPRCGSVQPASRNTTVVMIAIPNATMPHPFFPP